jgi:hypothetical protein
MTIQERRIMDAAVVAFAKTTGIAAKAIAGDPKAILEVHADRRKHRFGAEVKIVDRFSTPAMIKASGNAFREPPVLIAPYITREVAECCRQLRLPFIDTAGNAYLEAPGLLVYVVGHARPPELLRNRYAALKPAGLKLTFALLCRQRLLDESYRKIAMDAGVALGTVSSDMKDLETRGFFSLKTHPHLRKLIHPKRMLDEWVTHYPIALRPKLILGRFQAEPERIQQIDLQKQNAFWGGEPAAEKLTQYLKPAVFTIYAQEPIAKLVAAGRMRAAENGNVEILQKFWEFEKDETEKEMNIAPPILAYADLLATHDSRNVEAAQMIYEQEIAPAFNVQE